MMSFHFSYLMGLSTIDNIIRETCSAIWQILYPLVLPSEFSENQWLAISREFEELWQFPHAIAAIDGKHVRVQV